MSDYTCQLTLKMAFMRPLKLEVTVTLERKEQDSPGWAGQTEPWLEFLLSLFVNQHTSLVLKAWRQAEVESKRRNFQNFLPVLSPLWAIS